MIKLCIFDLDGTLVNTIESLWYTVNRTLSDLTLPPITKDECRQFVGNGVNYLLKKSLETAGDPEYTHFDEAKALYLKNFSETCTYELLPYPGLKEAVEELKEKGMLLAVFTNKPQEMAQKVVETFFGKGYFDLIVGQSDERPRKPDPAGIYEILSRLDVKKEECCFMGDSETDLAAGRNAGVRTITTAWGFRSPEFLRAKEPACMIMAPDELVGAVLDA